MVNRYSAILLEERRGTFAAIPSAAFGNDSPVDPAALQSWFASNADRFARPEQRSMRYALVDAEQIAAQARPDDKTVQDYYRANAGRYAASTERTVKRLVLPGESAARDIAAKAKAGGALDDLARQAGLSTSTLPALSRDAATKELGADTAKQIFDAVLDGIVGPATRAALGLL